MDLIIGAGISGISYANFTKNDYLVIEKEKEAGGYCRTIKRNNFVWDYSGHFFHFQHPELEKYVCKNIEASSLLRVEKCTKIYYKGKYIDFEAKETKTLSFPFTNISLHQINHLDKVIHHGGIAFLIIAFTKVNEVYLLDASFMVEAYRKNDRKSLRYETIKEKGHLIRQGFLPRLHYLEIIDQYYCEVFK